MLSSACAILLAQTGTTVGFYSQVERLADLVTIQALACSSTENRWQFRIADDTGISYQCAESVLGAADYDWREGVGGLGGFTPEDIPFADVTGSLVGNSGPPSWNGTHVVANLDGDIASSNTIRLTATGGGSSITNLASNKWSANANNGSNFIILQADWINLLRNVAISQANEIISPAAQLVVSNSGNATEDLVHVSFTDAGNGDAFIIDKDGNIGILQKIPLSPLHMGLPTEDFEIVDSGTIGATAAAWVEIQIGGVTFFLRAETTK